MKKAILAIVVSCVSVFLLQTPVHAKTWNLRYTGSYMAKNPILVEALTPYFKELAEKTDNQIKIRMFNPNTLCPVLEIYSSIATRAIDLGGINHTQNTGLFPLHDVFMLPLISSSSAGHGQLAWEFYQKMPALQAEMKNIHVLGYWAGGSMQIMTKKKQVKTMSDLEGLRIGVLAKPFADMISAWGANPIILTGPDLYLALARNQVDGVFFTIPAMTSNKLQEHIKYVTVGNFSMDTFYLGMNKKLWLSLPADIQQTINTSLEDNWAARISSAMDNAQKKQRKQLTEEGLVFYDLTNQEKETWVQVVKHIETEWLETVVERDIMTLEEAQALLQSVRQKSSELAPQ